MASNQDQYNEKNAELIAAFEDLLKQKFAALNLNGAGVGAAAGADSLDEIAVGNAETVRSAIGFVGAVLVEINKYGIGALSQPNYPLSDLDGDPSDILAGDYVVYSSVSNLPGNNAGIVSVKHYATGRTDLTYRASFDVRSYKRRHIQTSGWQGGWYEDWGQKNTTVDSNGFIKKASPIFRLANVAQAAAGDGFTLDGCGAYNSESEGVTASHDDVGVYTVSGSLGFADDGWTIEIPQDVNGNRLCFVETETADDGTITVHTFGRRFDYETAMIVAGDPIDIPDGRWIDLRLKMPEAEAPTESADEEHAPGIE